MVLIVGGRCQGKLSFARELIRREEIRLVSAVTVGETGETEEAAGANRTPDLEQAFSAGLICHLERDVRVCMEEKKDAMEWAERLIKENPQAVVIADEIGCGIVPVDAFEREYRETAGRVCQRLAAESEAVYRVVCGIGNRIK